MEQDDEFVREEEAAAAAAAGKIGGDPGFNPADADPDGFGRFADPAFQAVEEGGGGEAEGFEQAERELIRRASHEGEPGPDPQTHQGKPEPDRPDTEYGEADDVRLRDA